ncbi:endoglucanase-like isoform X2 [Bradysia coprophila]|uniref:endoglucanase-like isoform X2 n=1 Tax=Bradysia coprophila TaxID=38358 RepID=UPI00187D71EF|nr:endoglucanase-like isoform X2 [Bradysia coprophila]
MSAQAVFGLFIIFMWSANTTTARSVKCPSYMPPNAAMVHPSDNTKYLRCDVTGYLSEQMCPPGTIFDALRSICIRSAKVDVKFTTPCPPATTTKCPCPTPTPCPPTPTDFPVTPTRDPVTPTRDPVTPTRDPVTPTRDPVTPTRDPITPTRDPVTPTPPNGTTTPCVGCEYGQPKTTLPPFIITPAPEDECKLGKVDIPRPIVTTPHPVECE